MDVNEIEVFVKIQKKNFFLGGVGGGWGVGLGDECVDVNEEYFCENLKKKKIGGGGGGGGSVGGSGWGVRVDVNEELKFL